MSTDENEATQLGFVDRTEIVEPINVRPNVNDVAWSQIQDYPDIDDSRLRISWRWCIAALTLVIAVIVIGVETNWYVSHRIRTSSTCDVP